MNRVGVILAMVFALGVVVALAVYGNSIVFTAAVLLFAAMFVSVYLLPRPEDYARERDHGGGDG